MHGLPFRRRQKAEGGRKVRAGLTGQAAARAVAGDDLVRCSGHVTSSGTRPRFNSHQHFHSSRSLVFLEIAGREVQTS